MVEGGRDQRAGRAAGIGAARALVAHGVPVAVLEARDRIGGRRDQHRALGAPGSADVVLTFRNVHSWYDRNGGDDGVLAAFRAFNQVLKPGGTLGIVEHRLPAGRPKSDQAKSGYMLQAEVIRLAEQAGFTLTGISNINANPRDTADHPAGVWTLPPSLRLGETHQDRYRAIGESDRMTLRFEKTR